MVDSRAGLPQALSGDSLGMPCARMKPRAKREPCGLPSVEFKVPEDKGFHLPGGNADTRHEMIAYAGATQLSLSNARSRSEGCLRAGGPLDRVLKLRKETDLERLVEVLVRAAPSERRDELRYFKQPFNPNREKERARFVSEEERRKRVLQILRKYPLCDIYDLVRVGEQHWSDISRDLGGISYGAAMKAALEMVKSNFTPLERATFWAAIGNRQRISDHHRTCVFAAHDRFPDDY
eukprot:TRINITY_DN6700_c0_g2_i1.p1 TRINITY_DN6700_c0_g2~~TRINITY_DN6700_c0_g2_i1.p1  ORF type:complete len:236 (-),score=24.56 TRINITY_DN6700_c0_g2_i1:33-740(-)